MNEIQNSSNTPVLKVKYKPIKFLVLILGVVQVIGYFMLLIANLTSNTSFQSDFLNDNYKNISNILRYVFALLLFIGFGLSIWLIKKKHVLINHQNLTETSEYYGATLTLAVLGVILFWPPFVWALLIVLWIALYTTGATVYFYIKDNFGGNKWQSIYVIGIPTTIIIYISNFQADIILSETFGADPKHFSYSKPFAIFMFWDTILFFISSFSIIKLFFSYQKKVDLLKIDNITNKKEYSQKENRFHAKFISSISAALIIFVFSISTMESGSSMLKALANTVDFNPNHICTSKYKYEGYIFLDPAYKKVLVSFYKDTEGGKPTKELDFITKDCLN